MNAGVGAGETRFQDLLREWTAASPDSGWDAELSRMTEEWRAVEWRSGGTTLLAGLGLQFNEVYLCRGLAWLLDPDGGHQMGRHPLHALLRSLDVDVADGAPVEIRVEEGRADTRADVILRVGGRTVIIEAKVLSGEQPRQADRLHAHWKREEPVLVFLTRTGLMPDTAVESRDMWVARTWRDIAQLMRAAAGRAGLQPSAGAREYIETIGAL